MLDVYPKGAIFIYFYGRVHVIKGEIDEAISRFEEGVTAQLEWVQYHHMCYWELMWCHCYNLDWRKAADFAELLLQGSRWSKATYTYQKAVFLCMLTDTSSNQEEIVNLFRKVPSLKQRIAGKSLPIEKFAVKKSQRYFNQENMLILPAVELVYVWNGFTILGKNKDLITSILSIIQEAENLVNKSNGQYRTDNLCLVKLLKGMCLRYLDSPLQAEECFTEVYRNEKNIIEDHYLVPYSLMELGLLSLNQGDLITAQALLEKSKNDYKGFSLESRLHFRVHSSLNLIKSMQQQFLTLPDNYNPLPSPSPSPVPSPIPSPSTCE
ncbi:TTC39B (predicted) [Pycnogonum litorale]